MTYSGDQTRRELQIADQRRIADGDTGSRIFLEIPDGNGTFSALSSSANNGTVVIENTALLDPRLYDEEPYVLQFTSETTYEVIPAAGGPSVSQGIYEDGETITFQGIELRLSGEPQVGDELQIEPSKARDVFTTIDEIIEALEAPVQNETFRAIARTDLNAGLYNLDQALGRVLEVRTDIGSRPNALENQESSNEELGIQLRATLSNICLLYTSPSPRDLSRSRMPSSA